MSVIIKVMKDMGMMVPTSFPLTSQGSHHKRLPVLENDSASL